MKLVIITETDDRIGITEVLLLEDDEVQTFIDEFTKPNEDTLDEPVDPVILDWDGQSKFLSVVLADDCESKSIWGGEQFETQDEADIGAKALEERLRESGDLGDHHMIASEGLPIRDRKSEGRYDAMFRDILG